MSDCTKVYTVSKTKNFLKNLRNFKLRYFVSYFCLFSYSFSRYNVSKMKYTIFKHNCYRLVQYKKYLRERILKLRIISALVHSIMAMGLIFSHCLNPQTFFLHHAPASASCHSYKSKICKCPNVGNKKG